MDYFDYKDVLGGWILISYFLYSLILIVKRYVLKQESLQILYTPITSNAIINNLLITLTYLVTIPVFTYYFGKVLRLFYCQFVDRQDNYLIRQGFFSDSYDSRIISSIVGFYFFLLIKLIISLTTRYTIRKDNFIVISVFTFMIFFEAWGKGHDIRTYSHLILIELFFLTMYFVVRNKVVKDFSND
ncbi:MAG: hypothetical protein RL542_1655 [Bacteroidota bacterium]|jgi:hypothetical protein